MMVQKSEPITVTGSRLKEQSLNRICWQRKENCKTLALSSSRKDTIESEVWVNQKPCGARAPRLQQTRKRLSY